MKFSELSKDAQDRAIEEHGNFLTEQWRGEDDFDCWEEQLAAAGFEDAEIDYCIGSYNGTDGVLFKASVNDELFIKKFITEANKKERAKIRKRLDFAFKHDLLSFSIYDKGCSRHVWKSNGYIENNASTSFGELIDETCGDNEFKRVCFQAIHGTEADFEALNKELTDFIEAERCEWCDKIEKALMEDYEYQSNREYIIESIEANDYDFDEDGDIIPYKKRKAA